MSTKQDLSTSPRRFAEVLRRDARVSSLPIEFGFTPPIPLAPASERVVTFGYRTPNVPGKGFVLLAPEYRIEADYGAHTVLDIRQVSPSEVNLGADELGPIQNIHMSFEEIERMDRDFDTAYEKVMRAFIEQRGANLGPEQQQRMREIVPIIIDPRFHKMLAHESPGFVNLLDDSIGAR